MFGISVFMSLFEQFEQNFMGGVRADMKKCATCAKWPRPGPQTQISVRIAEAFHEQSAG